MKTPSRKTVLLVDDDASIVELVVDRLQYEGYATLAAYSAEEGLRLATRRQPDLIILDLGMPGMTGMTFLNQIRLRLKQRPPILVFTARSHQVEEVRRTGLAEAVLVKTADPSALLAEVRRLLGEATPEPSGPAPTQ